MDQGIIIATIVTAIVFLGVLGLAKSCVGGQKWYYSVIETIIVGGIAAGAAFGIGKAFG